MTSVSSPTAAREQRMDIVRGLVRDLSDEEWHHNWFAHRDLDVLED